MVVLGIGDGGLQRLLHVLGDALARKGEIGERAVYLLAADQLRQQVELLRADAYQPRYSPRLVVFQRPFARRLAHDLSLYSLGLAVRGVAVEGPRRRKLS